MGVFLMNEFCSIDHDLVVDTGQSVDDLIEHLNSWILAFSLLGYDLENVSVEIEGIFQLRYLVFELKVFFFQQRELLLHDI
jgi:hypothetical protein